MRFVAGLLTIGLLAGCATKRVPALAPTPDAGILRRLSDADALVRVGCLDCLFEALQAYQALESVPASAHAARAGVSRASRLLAIRQAELGMMDEGYWAQPLEPPQTRASTLLDLLDALPLNPTYNRKPSDAASLGRTLAAAPEVIESGRAVIGDDPLSAYAWLAVACGPRAGTSPAVRLPRASLGLLQDVPLIVVKDATSCVPLDRTKLEGLLADEPRYKELHYDIAAALLANQDRPGPSGQQPDIDGADRHFQLAYEWRQAWPALTMAIANLAMTTEDFERALEFYDKTRVMTGSRTDLDLGRVRALTSLGRYESAIAATEPLFADPNSVGEASYWRALNETQIDRDEEAWADIEAAGETVREARVPKLAGVIAIKRRQPDTARTRLEEARRRKARERGTQPDCDIAFYLQAVMAEQADWRPASETAIEAAVCFEEEGNRLRDEMAYIKANVAPSLRKDRMLVRRERQLTTGARRYATARFNAAVAMVYLMRMDDARTLAATLVDDEQFGERAKAIMARPAR